ncbi:MAG: class I SAM-dependent methyltransferase, partial [Prevotellaceae bacterium]|nr:class I SAM-dependent methyltransferase [Prevotellaceae bacterium]
MESFKCKICGNAENNTPLKVREMMFGLREEFPYFRCADCGCLQIVEPPKDMEKYYDADKYYSYHMQVKTGKARDWLHRLLFFLFKCRLLPANLRYLRCFSALDIIRKVKKRAAILDIGCGDGRLIQDMGVWGWKNLTGIDPFVEKDTVSPYGAKVLKQNIFEHSGQYDFIMMHHSLEHIDNQHEIFRLLNRLLKPDGALLIRIPVADGYPYRKYGASWFAIDAPRHYYL